LSYTWENMEQRKPDIQWIENLSIWMDSKFRLPGTDIRFGLDPLIGLVPFVGEMTTFVISSALVLSMAKYGASRKVIVLMVLNVLLDALIGSIPIVGNIFDFTYRANQRNVRLLKRHYEEGKYQGTGNGIIIFVFVVLLAGLLLLGYGLFKLTQLIFDQIAATF
jgi:hypothetical protein